MFRKIFATLLIPVILALAIGQGVFASDIEVEGTKVLGDGTSTQTVDGAYDPASGEIEITQTEDIQSGISNTILEDIIDTACAFTDIYCYKDDFNDDGKLDYVQLNKATGEVKYYEFAGTDTQLFSAKYATVDSELRNVDNPIIVIDSKNMIGEGDTPGVYMVIPGPEVGSATNQLSYYKFVKIKENGGTYEYELRNYLKYQRYSSTGKGGTFTEVDYGEKKLIRFDRYYWHNDYPRDKWYKIGNGNFFLGAGPTTSQIGIGEKAYKVRRSSSYAIERYFYDENPDLTIGNAGNILTSGGKFYYLGEDDKYHTSQIINETNLDYDLLYSFEEGNYKYYVVNADTYKYDSYGNDKGKRNLGFIVIKALKDSNKIIDFKFTPGANVNHGTYYHYFDIKIGSYRNRNDIQKKGVFNFGKGNVFLYNMDAVNSADRKIYKVKVNTGNLTVNSTPLTSLYTLSTDCDTFTAWRCADYNYLSFNSVDLGNNYYYYNGVIYKFTGSDIIPYKNTTISLYDTPFSNSHYYNGYRTVINYNVPSHNGILTRKGLDSYRDMYGVTHHGEMSILEKDGEKVVVIGRRKITGNSPKTYSYIFDVNTGNWIENSSTSLGANSYNIGNLNFSF